MPFRQREAQRILSLRAIFSLMRDSDPSTSAAQRDCNSSALSMRTMKHRIFTFMRISFAVQWHRSPMSVRSIVKSSTIRSFVPIDGRSAYCRKQRRQDFCRAETIHSSIISCCSTQHSPRLTLAAIRLRSRSRSHTISGIIPTTFNGADRIRR